MAGPNLPSLAWRNLWRNKRRTAITLFSIAFGVLLAVLSTGLGDASYGDMINYAARIGGGHVVVQHEDYAKAPSPKSTVSLDASTLAAIEGADHVTKALPRIHGAAMLSTPSNSVGAGVLAIDPTREDGTTFGLFDSISEGSVFDGPDDAGVVIGDLLAQNLELKVGDEVDLTITQKSGALSNQSVTVVGLMHTGAPEVDSATCLVPLNQARAMLGYGEHEATQLAVFIDDHHRSTAVASAIDSIAEAPATALSWDEASPDLAGFISLKQGGNVVLQAIVTVLIAAGIFNTLFVSVMERMREFGIMAAIGFSARQLFGLVAWESLWLGLCGIVSGAVLTAAPYWYLATNGIDTSELMGDNGTQVAGVTMSPILRIEIYPPNAIIIGAAILFATMIAGLYPAWRAGRVQPVKVIRIS